VAFISKLPLHQYQFMKFAAVCLDVASCSLVGKYEPFAGTCCLCRQRTRLYGLLHPEDGGSRFLWDISTRLHGLIPKGHTICLPCCSFLCLFFFFFNFFFLLLPIFFWFPFSSFCPLFPCFAII